MSKNKQRNAKLYLQDIEDSISNISKYTKGLSFKSFADDHKTIDAVVRNLEIIGEAVKNLPKEIKTKHADVPWNEICGMRNKAIHEYWGVDEEILWKTVKDDLPVLGRQIVKIKQESNSNLKKSNT